MPPKKATPKRTAESAGLEDHTGRTSKNSRPEQPKVDQPEASAPSDGTCIVKEAKSPVQSNVIESNEGNADASVISYYLTVKSGDPYYESEEEELGPYASLESANQACRNEREERCELDKNGEVDASIYEEVNDGKDEYGHYCWSYTDLEGGFQDCTITRHVGKQVVVEKAKKIASATSYHLTVDFGDPYSATRRHYVGFFESLEAANQACKEEMEKRCEYYNGKLDRGAYEEVNEGEDEHGCFFWSSTDQEGGFQDCKVYRHVGK